MISCQCEPTVITSGCQLTAVVQVCLSKHASRDGWLFAGSKRPLAVICHTEAGEQIFDAQGHRINRVELKTLMIGRTG